MHVGKKMKYMEKKFEEEKKFREKEERIKNEEEGDEEEEGEKEEEERMRKERILEDRMRIIEDGIRKNAKEKEVRKIRPKEEKIFMKRKEPEEGKKEINIKLTSLLKLCLLKELSCKIEPNKLKNFLMLLN